MEKALKVLKIVAPAGIGIYLTWFFFNGLTEVEITQVKDSFRDANYLWVILGLGVAFLSHVSRAKRWLYLVEPLGFRPKLWTAYHGVMAAYVINYTIPRSGEFARAGLMAKYEKVPFEKGFATIVVERIIDVIMLGIVVLITGLVQVDSEAFEQIMETQDAESSQLIYWLILLAVVLGLIGLILYFKNEKIRSFIQQKVLGLWEGLTSIWKMEQKWPFILHTFFIWACYVSGIWIFAQAFPETAYMPIGAILGAFVVGAAAIALLPGGLGAYPLWINAVLALYDIHFAGYGIFMWVCSTAFYIVLGLASLFLIQSSKESSN
ncbi:MAG: flippase-like domain-containing protein [Saprospiraceae bacterium]|nr:flippase-like domain-containing protein [Saprospiraceae bacterium]